MLSKHTSNIIFLLFIFVLTSSITTAQIKIGLNVGANLAEYKVDGNTGSSEFSKRTGLSIGAISEYQISKRISVRLNAGYIQSGGKIINPLFGNFENTVSFDYVQLSPFITYKVINSKIFAKIIGGFSFGHLVNAKVNSQGIDTNIKDNFYLLNIASNFGLEIEKTISPKTSLILSGIYSIGLKNISKYGSNIKTSDININVGFLYNLY